MGICFAIALLLVGITDLITAGITLASLSLTSFYDHGLQYIVPSNLALGIALLMFAYLIKTGGHPGTTFYILNLLAIGIHPMGWGYTALAIILGGITIFSAMGGNSARFHPQYNFDDDLFHTHPDCISS